MIAPGRFYVVRFFAMNGADVIPIDIECGHFSGLDLQPTTVELSDLADDFAAIIGDNNVRFLGSEGKRQTKEDSECGSL